MSKEHVTFGELTLKLPPPGHGILFQDRGFMGFAVYFNRGR